MPPLGKLLLLAAVTSLSATAAELTEQTLTVERIRGLKFTGPVVQKTISRDELREYISSQFAKQLPLPVPDYLRVLDALELIENEEGTFDRLLALYESQVLAFYDPPSNIYYSLSEAPKDIPLNEMMISGVAIHELTHALQDQRFDAGDRLFAMRGNSDAQIAYQAVLEGEAMLVMMGSVMESMGQSLDALVKNDAFVSALSSVAGLNAGIPEDIPPFFLESLKFPYLDGMKFVIEVYRRGAWTAVNRLHQSPPVSTEEILHPELYFARTAQTPRAAPPPPAAARRAGRATLLEETMGEFTWRFLLGEKPAAGWERDFARITSMPGERLGVSIESWWDSENDAREFAEAYGHLLQSRSIGAKITRQKRRVSVSYLTR